MLIDCGCMLIYAMLSGITHVSLQNEVGIAKINANFVTQTKQFSCPFDRFVWLIVHITFSLSDPNKITNMFSNFLNTINMSELVLCVGLYGTIIVILF